MIALLACAVLLYEVAITRILSVVLWYHFAFLSMSLAMLGLGLPGVWYSLRPPTDRSLARSLYAAAISLPLSVTAILQGGQWIPHEDGNELFIAFVVVCILVPMISLGSGVCILLLRARRRRIGKMYGSDLLGAMAGAILILPLMFAVPTPLILAGSGFLPLAALVLMGEPRRRLVLAIGVALAGAMVVGEPFEVRYNKLASETASEYLFKKWTPTARITILPYSPYKVDQDIPWGWGYGALFRPHKVQEWWIDQDGSAGTPIVNPGPSLDSLDHLLFDVTSVGYQLRPPRTVGIVGPGGGRDILTALMTGATSIDAVELNGAIVSALSGPFREFSGDVYHRPGVNAVVSEGRSYLSRTQNTYDLLQISLVDSWAATAAGAYALSENYLYTIESFQLYHERLSETGLLSVSRYLSGDQQMEGTRISLLAIEALRRLGVEDAKRHIAVVQGGRVGTLLLSRTPWSDADLQRLAQIAGTRGFNLLWPQLHGGPAVSMVTRSILHGADDLNRRGFDMAPPTDDRPFFFQALSVWKGPGRHTADLGFNEYAVVLLRRVVIAITLVSVVLFFVPFLLAGRLERHPGFWKGSVYFAALGLAFMLVELPWIQRYILYLGHPSYATTVVISALLLGAGIGAAQAGRLESPRSALRLAVILPLTIVATNFLLVPIFSVSMGWPLVARSVIGALTVLPAGFVMGFAFPTGMRCFGDPNKAWFWAMNGVMSVVGSVTSLGLAMIMGFSNVVLVGVAAYLVAWVMIGLQSRVVAVDGRDSPFA